MFKNLKIRSKLALGFVLVLILSTMVTIASIVNMNKIAASTNLMFEHPYTVHTEILRVQRNVMAMGREMKDVLLLTDRQALQNKMDILDELEQVALEAFDTLYEKFLGDIALLDNAQNALLDWKPIRDEVIRLQMEDKPQEARAITEGKGAQQIQLIEASIQEVVDFARNSATNFNQTAQQDANNARNMIIILLAVVYAIAIISSILITRSITRPVSNLLSFTEKIANGNLAIKAIDYKSKDEIGILAQALNAMRVNLRDMVKSVTESVQTVNSSSGEMATTTQETSAAVEELASTANQFTSAVERLSNNAQEMASDAETTNKLSHQGVNEIESTTKTMNEINEAVINLANDIRQLGEQSEKIGEIVTLITGIADQTNLLALNAAIEAARAGEQGRGFAVVAEEVRKLAEQSAQAAGEITTLIYEIRNSAQNSVQRTDESAEKVQEGMEIVTHSGQVFSDIVNTIDSLVLKIDEVASATQELAAGAEEMGATTEEQSASTQQMAASAEEVSEAAAAVELEMRQFKIAESNAKEDENNG